MAVKDSRARFVSPYDRDVVATALIAICYALTAHLGFRLAVVADQVTTVWPPSGIAIAALLLWGPRLLPAVWLGAFAANALVDAPLWAAASIASGNTAEALTAWFLLSRLGWFDRRLRRVNDAVAFILLAAGAATMVSATVGVLTLCGGGLQAWDRFGVLWRAWWLGDAVGTLIVAPVLLTLGDHGLRSWRHRAEAVALAAAALLVTLAIFRMTPEPPHHPLEYLIFPFVVAAAMRGGPALTAVMVLSSSSLAIASTAAGQGPFAGAPLHDSLVLLQLYMGVLAGTGLLLSAAIAERETIEQERAATARDAGHDREQLLAREAAARADAEAANRAKDEFLATLSHELRTPLNAIVGWTRMLSEGVLDAASTRHALEVIERNAHLQAQLVADILDVSRIITGKVRLDLRPVELGTIVGAALDAVRPAAAARQLQVRAKPGPVPRIVNGDPERLQQVVWNLLSNAVKFTEPGGWVQVEITEGAAGHLLVRVSDNGTGIDAEFLPYVFERFRQADGSRSRQHGGLGLGLAIVRHLVELHGGTVHVRSDGVGLGATFTVELPAAPMTVGSLSATPAPLNAAGVSRALLDGVRVLVVDDHDDGRELAAAMLRASGAGVRTAGSVAEALHALDLATPDVLLSDIGMPDADGYVLIREVRRRDAARGTRLPAAAVTAYAGERDRDLALAAGFDVHLPKPVSQDALIAAVLALVAPPTPDHR